MNHCQQCCLGIKGNSGGCCTLDDRDWIMGPVHDSHEVLERVKNKFPGIDITWNDLFITFEEGSKMFPERSNWQDPANFPCMRVLQGVPRNPCLFYNLQLKSCMIYEIRPNTCKSFHCEYLKYALFGNNTHI